MRPSLNDGEPILLGAVGAGQFIGEMGVVENRPRSATAQAASEVEIEILTPTEFFDQIAGSPPAARELIQRLSQRLRAADDRIVNELWRSLSELSYRSPASGCTSGAPSTTKARSSTCWSRDRAVWPPHRRWLIEGGPESKRIVILEFADTASFKKASAECIRPPPVAHLVGVSGSLLASTCKAAVP
jgi:hypothetical protein